MVSGIGESRLGGGFWGLIRCQFLSQLIIYEPPTMPRTLKKFVWWWVVGGGGGGGV